MCINVCNYFKSQTTRFNAALFGIINSTPTPRFDEVERIKQGIPQELADTPEMRVVVVRVVIHRVVQGTVSMIEMG